MASENARWREQMHSASQKFENDKKSWKVDLKRLEEKCKFSENERQRLKQEKMRSPTFHQIVMGPPGVSPANFQQYWVIIEKNSKLYSDHMAQMARNQEFQANKFREMMDTQKNVFDQMANVFNNNMTNVTNIMNSSQ